MKATVTNRFRTISSELDAERSLSDTTATCAAAPRVPLAPVDSPFMTACSRVACATSNRRAQHTEQPARCASTSARSEATRRPAIRRDCHSISIRFPPVSRAKLYRISMPQLASRRRGHGRVAAEALARRRSAVFPKAVLARA